MTTPWTHITEAPTVDPLVTAIHCDTRDFAVMHSYTTPTKEDDKEVYRLLHGAKINERYLMHQDQITPWLRRIEEISGGRNEWRCLSFTHITTTKGWLKHIHFYRYTADLFVVCDSYSTPIDWQRCDEQTIEKEFLNAHS